MPDLVALHMEGGPGFVRALEKIWLRGDAVLPLDPRAPRRVVSELLNAFSPARVMDGTGEESACGNPVPVEPDDALVVATSGAGGQPKGVVLTREAVEASAYATTTALGVTPAIRWLACLPLNHIGGLSVVTRALITGAELEVHPSFDPARVEAAARAGSTHISLVPTMLRRIDPSLFVRILLGGSAIPEDRPVNTVASYGMTETGSGVVYDGLPLNGVEVRIGSAGPTPGEILVRSHTLLRCYRDGTDPKDSAGWFRTGDVGHLAAGDRRLVVEGRADELIITGGENVWPQPVEEVLRSDPRVRDVAVVGRPDEEWGERVVAMVVPQDPRSPPRLQDLRRLVKERLPAYSAPKELLLVDALPRTTLGKLRRGELPC
ncbi:MAG: putative 2-succinylbenzoate--CoA ligase [Acidimicrobiales bacterium]|nr:MAG: AMP-dependent synthetase [Actinomycetota bacterium]MBV6509603.1 putative 2-succinylbenzoate--CoA ligase [Acidimicrobiales bacterium]RIK06535.1 MAG: AMP-dependent synthetase [Acidobacteriota bacterium]